MNRSRVAAPFHLAPVAALGMILAVVLGACGASATPTPAPTPPPDPTQILQNGVTALATLKSVHVDVELSGAIQNPGSATASAGPIVLDGTKLSLDIDIANQKGTASLVTPAALGGLTADLIVSGDIYVKAPLLLKTDKWSQIPAATVQSLGLGEFVVPLPSAPSASASPIGLDSLLGMSGITVTSQGTDACADGTCDKIAITISAAQLKQAATAATAANPFGAGLSGLGSLGSLGDATITVWTATSSGRLNKLTLAASAGSAGNIALTVTLSKFDVPVTVTPPPADQVQPFSLGG